MICGHQATRTLKKTDRSDPVQVSPPTCGLPHWKIHELAKKTGKQPIVVDGAPSLNISFDDIGDAPEDDEYESLEITNAELAEQLLQEAAENAQDAAAGADPNVDAELGEVTDDAQEEA